MNRGTLKFMLAGLIPVVLIAFGLVYQNARSTNIMKQRHGTPATKIVVFAAAGLTKAMQDCAALYEAQYDCRIELNLASSAVLARQIAAGAQWDVYLSANRQWMDYVLEHTAQSPDGVSELAADRLVLVAPAGQAADFSIDEQFAKTFAGRLATGDPLSIPVGMYARQALENLGWWDDLSDNVIGAVSVCAAQRYVEAGQCEMGIIFLSGAKMSRKVNIVRVFDTSLHDPIRFLATANKSSEPGGQFLAFLTGSPQAAEVFIQNGFEAVDAHTNKGPGQ